MKTSQTKMAAFIVILSLSSPLAIVRADVTQDSANDVALSTGTTTQKHHRKHKSPPPSTSTVPANPATTNVPAEVPEGTDKPINAGLPNMGTGDHTPGTTGTSGQ